MQKDDGNKIEMKPAPQTVGDYIKLWADKLAEQGKQAFWPSWAAGTYIRDDNQIAKQRHKAMVDRRLAKEKEKKANPHKTFNEDNALQLIANVLLFPGTRQARRALCKRLGLSWSDYKEGEAIIMESDDWSGYKMDAIAAAHGVKK